MGIKAMVTGLGAASLLLSGTLVGFGAASSSAETASSVDDVRVGSFNLNGVNNDDRASGNHLVWRLRRPAVVSQILAKHTDVLGLQEANQSTIYKSHLDFGDNQYLDLVGALRHAGAPYEVTNAAMYNCERSQSSQNCDYVNRNASNDTRIIFNSSRVRLLDQGSVQYDAQTAGKNVRYYVWAKFAMRSTGHEFFFATTHLDPYQASTRKAQWDQLISLTNRLHGSLPVVVTGDFNTSKFTDYAATYLPRMKSEGYGDVLNQTFADTTIDHPRAESLRNAWVGSFNDFRRNVADYGYEDARNKVGNGIDWIFASNNLEVKRWGVTVTMNQATAQVKGVIPSDHEMVRATLVIR